MDLDRASDAESATLLEKSQIQIPPRPMGELLLSGSAYVATSSALIIFNKHALASFHWQCPNSLLAFHCILAVVLVKAVEAAGLIKLEPLRWNVVRVWFPGGDDHDVSSSRPR